MRFNYVLMIAAATTVAAAAFGQQSTPQQGYGAKPELPTPSTSAVKFVKVVGWPAGKAPAAPAGFSVTEFGANLDHPRWLYALPNGDILVAEASTPPKPAKTEKEQAIQQGQKESKAITPSQNRISLLRDSNGDGKVETQSVFLENLNRPFGMVLVGNTLFVASTDAVHAYPYESGMQRMDKPGKKILTLPAGGYNNHWTRNLIANTAGTKLYVTVGSASNVAEHGMAEETRRANILEVNLDGSGERIFASGLRNPNGMDWETTTGALWTVVNERDELGDNLVPDYLTSVKDGGFYGWPFSYYGQNVDARVKPPNPELVKRALVPDYGLGAHTASLGLTFYRGASFPARFKGGAFIGQHGSWNRSQFSGYRVAFVPFANGKPSGVIEDFLSGFLASDSTAYGRPVGVIADRSGALLVADDAGNRIWRVAAAK